MAARDIRPYRNARGATFQVSAYSMAAGASFLPGEPVVSNGVGFITRATTDPSAVVGIAARSSVDVDGKAEATGTRISVIEVDSVQLWACLRFATDGLGTAVVPTQANAMGRFGGLTLSGQSWAVDIGAANSILRIEDVLDVRGTSVSNPSFHGTGVFVIFRFMP